MLLQELQVGEELELHVKWGGMEYEIPSKVEYNNKKSVLINAYSYSGKTIDFQSRSFREVVIDLYVKNHEGKRYCWRDVSVTVSHHFGKDFYRVKTHEFKKNSHESDRRSHDRIKLQEACVIFSEELEEKYSGIVKDVSRDGLAFYCEEKNIKQGIWDIAFTDYVRSHKFNLRFKVRIVREKAQKNHVVYGCKIMEASRDCLAFVYLKSIEKTENEAL